MLNIMLINPPKVYLFYLFCRLWIIQSKLFCNTCTTVSPWLLRLSASVNPFALSSHLALGSHSSTFLYSVPLVALPGVKVLSLVSFSWRQKSTACVTTASSWHSLSPGLNQTSGCGVSVGCKSGGCKADWKASAFRKVDKDLYLGLSHLANA